MSFMKPLAQSGTFGLAGLAATAGGDKKKKVAAPTPQPTLINTATQTPAPSLLSTKVYGG